MFLEPGPLGALVNLARKAAGQEVDWINIADAQALTGKGLAIRDRQGWRITDAGHLMLASEFPELDLRRTHDAVASGAHAALNARGEPSHE